MSPSWDNLPLPVATGSDRKKKKQRLAAHVGARRPDVDFRWRYKNWAGCILEDTLAMCISTLCGRLSRVSLGGRSIFIPCNYIFAISILIWFTNPTDLHWQLGLWNMLIPPQTNPRIKLFNTESSQRHVMADYIGLKLKGAPPVKVYESSKVLWISNQRLTSFLIVGALFPSDALNVCGTDL